MTARFVRVAFLSACVLGVVPMRAPAIAAQQVAYAATLGPELDSATQAQLTREFARARERGLPVEPLAAKVREGRLKNARGALIHVAVMKLAERLATARMALGAESTTDELIAAADALSFGADESSLRTVRAATTRSIAAPLGTLAQLVASGVAPRKAAEMIVTLMKRNATPAQLLALGNLVEVDVAAGLRANDAAIIRMRGIEGSLGLATGDALTAVGTPNTPPTPTTPVKGKPARRP
ncbi:MAG: hypothetical protein V4550_21445 [Gemmatimonadota bacterium]